MSHARPTHAWYVECFPRVSGDEPDSWLGNIDTLAFSPRERG